MMFEKDGDTLLVTKIDRLARSTSDPYRIISQLSEYSGPASSPVTFSKMANRGYFVTGISLSFCN
jgi:hypothetical protein